MVRQKTATSPDRWFDELRVSVGDRRRSRRLRRELLAGLPEVFGVIDLEKNGFERRVIAAAAAAINGCLADLGLAPRIFPEDRVHVLAPDEYADKIGGDTAGLTHCGHVYVQRTGDADAFIHHVTHELAHLASFLSVMVTLRLDEATGAFGPKGFTKKGGLCRCSVKCPEAYRFRGLNEAVTELFAHDARKRFVAAFGGLDERQKAGLLELRFYGGPILLTVKLLKIVAGDGDWRQARDLLYRDYLFGSDRFLRSVRAVKPEAPALLRSMDSAFSSAVKVARRLGFDDIADHLLRRVSPRRPA